MRRLITVLTLFAALAGFGFGREKPDVPASRPAVAELLEDNGETLLKQFIHRDGSGTSRVETIITYSGKSSLKIIPLQRYSPALPGWNYRITEKPGPGEYRYLRLAWKGDGCAGIMIQLHDQNAWTIRYTSGHNLHGWPSRIVSNTAPVEWEVVTIDLFKDFGERTLKGMALTVFGGNAGYFDHIYLGRTIDDLDRIDATGLRHGKPVHLTAEELEQMWQELARGSPPKAYLAFWKLVAAPQQSVPFLEKKLTEQKIGIGRKQLQEWILQLGHDKFRLREQASTHLAQHLDEAADLLIEKLENNPTPEVKLRIDALLAMRKGAEVEKQRNAKAVRVIEYIETPAATKVLARLARDGNALAVRTAATAVLQRRRAVPPK
jgi:hypothetical protein